MSKGYTTLHQVFKCLTREELDVLHKLLSKVVERSPELLKRRVNVQHLIDTIDIIKYTHAFFSSLSSPSEVEEEKKKE